jgi:outer membrane cobalamin receptor
MKQFVFFLLAICGTVGHINAQTNDSVVLRQIKEVEVTAKAKPSEARSSNPLQALEAADINRIGIQSVSDAVRRFTGIVVKDYGGVGGFKSIAIRGNGAEHTGVFYDGLAAGNAQSGQIDIGQFSLDNVDMISLTMGQSDDIFRTARSIASVGVLNIVTKTPFFGGKSYSAMVQLKAGSWGYFNPYIYYAQKLSDKFSVSIDGDWQRSDGQYPFERKNGNILVKGKRTNSSVDAKRAEINLFGNLTPAQTLSWKAYYYDSERELPGIIILQDSSYLKNKEKEQLWDKNFFTQAKYINLLSDKFRLQLQGKYAHSYTKYLIENPSLPIGYTESRYNQNELYASGTLLYQLSGFVAMSFAEDFSYNTLNSNNVNFAEPQRYSSLSALSAQYKSERLSITGSLLAVYVTDKVKHGNTPADRKKLSPALSASYRPFMNTNLRIRASYKNIFRIPTFNDLYYLRMGNSTLTPEKTQQYNIGVTWVNEFSDVFNYFNFTADYFYNTVDDKIVAYPTTFEPKMVNLGKVRISGLSLTANGDFHFSDKVTLLASANYTYQKAIDVTNSSYKNYKDQIPHTPVHSGAASISIENPYINAGYSLIASGRTYNSLQNIEQNKIDAYTDHTLSVNKTFGIGNCLLRLQAEITNIFDNHYYIVKDYPMPGRGYRVTLNVKF